MEACIRVASARAWQSICVCCLFAVQVSDLSSLWFFCCNQQQYHRCLFSISLLWNSGSCFSDCLTEKHHHNCWQTNVLSMKQMPQLHNDLLFSEIRSNLGMLPTVSTNMYCFRGGSTNSFVLIKLDKRKSEDPGFLCVSSCLNCRINICSKCGCWIFPHFKRKSQNYYSDHSLSE